MSTGIVYANKLYPSAKEGTYIMLVIDAYGFVVPNEAIYDEDSELSIIVCENDIEPLEMIEAIGYQCYSTHLKAGVYLICNNNLEIVPIERSAVNRLFESLGGIKDANFVQEGRRNRPSQEVHSDD